MLAMQERASAVPIASHRFRMTDMYLGLRRIDEYCSRHPCLRSISILF